MINDWVLLARAWAIQLTQKSVQQLRNTQLEIISYNLNFYYVLSSIDSFNENKRLNKQNRNHIKTTSFQHYMEASAIAKKGCQNDLMTVSTLEHLSSQMRFMRVQTAQMMCFFWQSNGDSNLEA